MAVPSPKTVAERNQYLFMAWLAREFPAIYNAHIRAAGRDPDALLSGFWDSVKAGVATIGTTIGKVIEQAPELLKQYGATQEQLATIKANLARAQAGQPPLNPDGTPVQPTQVVMQLPSTPAGQLLPVAQQIPPWAWGIGGLLLLALFMQRR